MNELRCLRCGHTWVPRSLNKPKSCPNCKNRKWYEDRDKNKLKNNSE